MIHSKLLGFCLLGLALVSPQAHAATVDEGAEALYQAFKLQYAAAETFGEIKEALPLVLKAHEQAPTIFKYAFGASAGYRRIEQYSECESWTNTALALADDDISRSAAEANQYFCREHRVDGKPVELAQATTIRRINFSTKEGSVGGRDSGAFRDLARNHSSKVLSVEADETLIDVLTRAVPGNYDVSSQQHMLFASPFDAAFTNKQKNSIVKYDLQLRQRFFPELQPQELVFILGEHASELRDVANQIFPGARFPATPFFGIYHHPDRLIFATSKVGLGTVLHELMHALVRADFADAPLWLDEGMAMLYERSGWSRARPIPLPNWRLDTIERRHALTSRTLKRVRGQKNISTQQLSVIRLVFTFLDDKDQLQALYQHTKSSGANISVLNALTQVGFDWESEEWRKFVKRSFNQYHLELGRALAGGLTTPAEIEYVQQALQATVEPDLKADGAWGPSTRRALEAFQEKFQLKSDGWVGDDTRRVLEQQYSKHLLRNF